jgi:hypothetical protein
VSLGRDIGEPMTHHKIGSDTEVGAIKDKDWIIAIAKEAHREIKGFLFFQFVEDSCLEIAVCNQASNLAHDH